jgi:hypothetical protein
MHFILEQSIPLDYILYWRLTSKVLLKSIKLANYLSITITVTEWYRTRRPIHCDHYRPIVLPHLSSNHS